MRTERIGSASVSPLPLCSEVAFLSSCFAPAAIRGYCSFLLNQKAWSRVSKLHASQSMSAHSSLALWQLTLFERASSQVGGKRMNVRCVGAGMASTGSSEVQSRVCDRGPPHCDFHPHSKTSIVRRYGRDTPRIHKRKQCLCRSARLCCDPLVA